MSGKGISITVKRKTLWLRHAQRLLEKTRSHASLYASMSDEQLAQCTEDFRRRIGDGKKLDALLPDAFAAVCEASSRTTGMRPYDVQIIGAIALHEGKMAEIATGEGKTLVAAMPAYLHALEGKGVHIVTVNDYLAQRDSDNIGRIFRFMGMTVGTVTSASSHPQRKQAYACDITYATNSELGFDYLRDNMAQRKSDTVMRGLHYAIIDEADSILIDEARTPLIISGESEESTELYRMCDTVAKRMERGKASADFNRYDAMAGILPEESGDFIVREKEKIVVLTAGGVSMIEKAFGIDRYGNAESLSIQRGMMQALRANYIMKRDKDYMVRNGEIQIIDQFTGRTLSGHEYSDGLQQAIQAKEGLEIRGESQTIATTSYQSFFMKYGRICGMTGTAWQERKEFMSTYGMRTVRIPTRLPVIRNDRKDMLFLTKKGKYEAVIREISEARQKGQPVLVGTASVRESETVSGLLNKAGIPHSVLNAKQDKEEADIVAQAGTSGTVTVATDIAGRGTDIILDDASREAGGLKVIGTERHDSSRIDDQLRGRSGRQGDPGETVFIVSAEDDIIRRFGGERIRNILARGGYSETEQIGGRALAKAFRNAQKKVEDNNYAARKDVLEYDMVIDSQRELVYEERRKLLEGESVADELDWCMRMTASAMVREIGSKGWNDENIASEYALFTGMDTFHPEKLRNRKTAERLIADQLRKDAGDLYFAGAEARQSAQRSALLTAIDTAWMEQIRALEFLKNGISYMGYAQRDPKTEYALRAYDLYDRMRNGIYTLATHMYFSSARSDEFDIIGDDITIEVQERKDGAGQ